MLAPAPGVTWKEFFLALKDRFLKDKLMDVAGSVTFFGILALFPFLLFLVTLGGLVLRPPQVEAFIQQIGNVAPADAARIIGGQIREIHRSQSVGLLTVGFVGAIWSASGGVVSLMDALNGLLHVDDKRPFWKSRGLAILTTFGASALVLLAAFVGVAAGPIAHAFGGPVEKVVTWLRLHRLRLGRALSNPSGQAAEVPVAHARIGDRGGAVAPRFLGILALRDALRRVQQDVRSDRRRRRHADVDVDLGDGAARGRAHQRGAGGVAARADGRENAGCRCDLAAGWATAPERMNTIL